MEERIESEKGLVNPQGRAVSDEGVIAGVHEKILAIMKSIKGIQESGEIDYKSGGSIVNYNFIPEKQLTALIKQKLCEYGLVIMPVKTVVHPIFEERTITYKDGRVEHTRRNVKTDVIVTYKIIDPETMSFDYVQVVGKGADSQDKDTNKAMTGAFKYMQKQLFFIPTLEKGEDPDDTPSKELDDEEDLDEEIGKLIADDEGAKKLAKNFKGDKKDLLKMLKDRKK